MKYNKLINKIENFYKLAGTLEYPVKMHQEILNWATSVYCSYVLEDINELIDSGNMTDEQIKKANFFISYFLKPRINNTNTSKEFQLDLSDISFLTDEVNFALKNKPELLDRRVSCVFFPYMEGATTEEGSSGGEIDLNSLTITISQDISPQISETNVLKGIANISSSIRHELQHLVQYYGTILKNLKYSIVGMPSTNISPIQTSEEQEELPSKLRNVEFYTKLSDSIDSLKSLFRIFPKKSHRLIFDTCIGKNTFDHFVQNVIAIMKKLNKNEKITKKVFFEKYYDYLERLESDSEEYKLMQKIQPEKYNKLVKELYKAVSDYL